MTENKKFSIFDILIILCSMVALFVSIIFCGISYGVPSFNFIFPISFDIGFSDFGGFVHSVLGTVISIITLLIPLSFIVSVLFRNRNEKFLLIPAGVYVLNTVLSLIFNITSSAPNAVIETVSSVISLILGVVLGLLMLIGFKNNKFMIPIPFFILVYLGAGIIIYLINMIFYFNFISNNFANVIYFALFYISYGIITVPYIRDEIAEIKAKKSAKS